MLVLHEWDIFDYTETHEYIQLYGEADYRITEKKYPVKQIWLLPCSPSRTDSIHFGA